MKRFLILGLFAIIAVVALRSSIIFVDAAEYVYVTQFGRPVATYNGNTDAGLQFKLPWPFQSVSRFDRRLQTFDVPTQEFLIRDRDDSGQEKPLPLTFDLFIAWRIGSIDHTKDSDGVDRFIRSFGTLDRAQQYLRTMVVSKLKVELGEIYLHDLMNTDASKLKINSLLENVKKQAGKGDDHQSTLESLANNVGIELVDVRLRRFNHPLLVREDIYNKIREERRRQAETYRNQGFEAAARIRAEGDLEARKLKAEAEATRTRKEGQAEAEAVKILNEAAQANPELYGIVRLLKGSQKMFADDKTQIILSLDHPLLSLFKNIPSLTPKAITPGGSKDK